MTGLFFFLYFNFKKKTLFKKAKMSSASIGFLWFKVQNFCECFFDGIFWTAGDASNKLECQAKKLQQTTTNRMAVVTVTVRAHIIKIQLFLLYLINYFLSQPNLVWWYTIISQSILWKDWIALFRLRLH